ncbi:MAG: phytoene desaturase family protein [Ginsengibacter sp.]
MATIAIIGSGFSGLSAAAYLSAAGHDVQVYEKNEMAGGRARQLRTITGYVFDMGPSWYWMPDIFERFFNDFGYSVSDFYELKLLNPSFEVVFAGKETISVPAEFSAICNLFESIERGSSLKLQKFMKGAQYKYEAGMKDFVYKPGLSLMEFADVGLIRSGVRLQIFSSFSKHVRNYFSNPRLIALMEFPVLFLGAMPQDTPALYSLMNYAALKLGTWYPQGGFGKVIEAIMMVAKKNGTSFHFNSPVKKIVAEDNLVRSIIVGEKEVFCDAVVATADYAYVENKLLPPLLRNYKEGYWKKKTFAPSCLIYYIGLSKKITLSHHTLFFDENLLQHSKEIYKNPEWPDKPLFYVCCPSQSDENVAPTGHENLFLLMPVAPGLEDSEMIREKYYGIIMNRLNKHIGEDIRPFVDFKKSYCITDFINDYHSYRGNAYGLANTLMQTAILKPKIRNKRIKNLFYAGQLTVPGPGVPPSLISGKIAAQQLLKQLKKSKDEIFI